MSKLSWRGAVLIGASAAILISLSLPWISVSDNEGTVAVYNGYTLSKAESTIVHRADYGSYSVYSGPPRFRMLVFVLSGIGAIALLLVFIAYARERIGLLTSMVWGLLGLLGLGVILTGVGQIQAIYGGIQIHCGFWTAAAGLAGAMLGSLLTLPRRVHLRMR